MRYLLNLNISACVSSVFIFLFAAISTGAYATQPYLEDADLTQLPTTNSNALDISQHLWPRVMMAETQTLAGNPEQYSKYRIIAASAHSIDRVVPLQRDNPNLAYFRTINPVEFLGYNDETLNRLCPQGHGNPFSITTPSTGNCGVFAGHWLYQAGALSTSAINANSTSIRVSDISRFSVNNFVVIYNAPAGSFNNAEHAKVTNLNVATSTLTIERGFKSDATAHPRGSIVAQHARGFNNPSPRNWRFNLSTQSARDANNRTYGQFLPIWMGQNINRNLIGELSETVVSGILFDSDFSFLFDFEDADVNNDLIVDNGISPNGTNWWGLGMEQFYNRVRTQFPDFIISGGIRDARGFDALNGTQFEGFPGSFDFFSPDPEYNSLASLLSSYSINTRRRSNGPVHSHILSKTPSRVYPFGTNPALTTNRTFRFSLGLTLLEDGYFGFRNSQDTRDVWFDEYAVDITRGSSNYGRAIESNQEDEAKIRSHLGWLGRPNGPRRRIYSDAEFAPQQAILSSMFNNNISGWEGQRVNVSLSTNIVRDGSGALRASNHTDGYQAELGDAGIRGPLTQVTNGQNYTFVFSARSSEARVISASIGGHTERFLLQPGWQRYVMTFRSTETGNTRPRFNLGRENSQVHIDTVHFFEGNANIFRRDFNNGIVVINATPNRRTIPLNGTFRRIRGQQDSTFNNGAAVSNLTLGAYDSAILVRLENDQPQADVQSPWITINAPTKLRVGPITNTTIVVRDQLSINANNVRLGPNNTAGVSNFNCTQASVNRVNCSLTITRTGDLKIRATDTAGNRSDETEAGFQINGGTTGDGVRPLIVITAPTTTSNDPITNTTVRVTDNIQIRAADIEIRDGNTAGVTNFNCTQASRTVVNCSLRIISSGDLKLLATDVAGNFHRAGRSNYVINNNGSNDTTRPTIVITAPTKISNQIIRNTTIRIRDNTSINAQDVELRSASTARTSNFNCQQDGATSVRCTVNVNSSGNIQIKATDRAGNEAFRNESGYQINFRDTTRPGFILTAPTKTSRSTIRDTRVIVRDNTAINAADVMVRQTSTAGINNFSCRQNNLVEVACSLDIISSGNLNLIATDRAGNVTFRNENGYRIISTPIVTPILDILLSE